MTVGAITLQSPAGGAWEFLVLFAVVILGPPIVQKARIPGLIGLLFGGFLIGAHGLGLLDEGSTTIPDLGQLGLLYLMFVAGVELDLVLLRVHRRAAITFGLLTFSFPMVLGTVAGLLLGWEVAAALLLGSLLASHTLVLYPLIRGAGLAKDPVVASAVGATVLTDTLALVILAIIAGTTSGSGSSAEIVLQLGLGLTTLLVFCFVVLPPLVRRAFRLLGGERTVRYVIAVASFLAAAVVAETFGIEGIVGAFFAGLAINRLVPNEGPLMNRIDFFGSAVFVPVFLVSVGLLLDPSVMAQPETLGLAAIFVGACMGGKLIAAQLTRPLLGADAAQANVVFALTAPQAAATLAATTVGFQIGLFSDSVVNAVLVLILVSVVAATVVAERAKDRVDQRGGPARAVGEHVLVAVGDMDAAPLALRLGHAIAEAQGGVVDVLLVAPPGSPAAERVEALDRLRGLCRRLHLDTDPGLRTGEPGGLAVVHAGGDHDASLVIAAERGEAPTSASASTPEDAPVIAVRGAVDQPLRTLEVEAPTEPDALMEAILEALPARRLETAPGHADGGSVILASVMRGDGAPALKPNGAALVLVPSRRETAEAADPLPL